MSRWSATDPTLLRLLRTSGFDRIVTVAETMNRRAAARRQLAEAGQH
jgi:hypothetical protein